jgi:hypothetical protein
MHACPFAAQVDPAIASEMSSIRYQGLSPFYLSCVFYKASSFSEWNLLLVLLSAYLQIIIMFGSGNL